MMYMMLYCIIILRAQTANRDKTRENYGHVVPTTVVPILCTRKVKKKNKKKKFDRVLRTRARTYTLQLLPPNYYYYIVINPSVFVFFLTTCCPPPRAIVVVVVVVISLNKPTETIFVFFFYFCFCHTGGRNVSHGRQTTARRMERHHARVAPAEQVHAQRVGRAAGQVLFDRSDVQGRTALHLRGHAKFGRGLGTSGS